MSLNTESHAALATAQTVAARIVQRGWDEAQGGNLSLALPTPPPGWERRGRLDPLPGGLAGLELGLLTTASGSRWRQAASAPDQACVYVQLADGQTSVWAAPDAPFLRPTSELPTHCHVHELRSAQGLPPGVVLHAHPPSLLAVSLLPAAQRDRALALLPRLFPEAALLLHKGIAATPYARPGSTELAQYTVNAFTVTQFAVWQKHGPICQADNAEQALDLLETAELAARVYWQFLTAGLEPAALTDQEAAGLAG